MKLISRVLLFIFALCVIFIYIFMNYIFPNKSSSMGNIKASLEVSPHHKKASSETSQVIDLDEHVDESNVNVDASPAVSKLQQIVVAVVACGDRLAETLVMIKSAIIFTKSNLFVIVFADEQLIPSFKEKLNEWRAITNESFSFELHAVVFPLQGSVMADEWRRLFKPCASQRLFLPVILSHVDSLLYMDTDTLFLGPVEDVWHHFELMNATQMAALAPEHEDPNTGWYNRFARHPYYGNLGVNSGVMLMNLTRMRSFSWTSYVIPIYTEYKLKITWGDQDIINIIFHFHPDKLYIYPCRYNYRPDHCMYQHVCPSAAEKGIAVLHGNRGSLHVEKQPFHAIYRAMEEYQLGTDLYMNLYMPMKNYLELTTPSNCGKVKHVFIKTVEQLIQKDEVVMV